MAALSQLFFVRAGEIGPDGRSHLAVDVLNRARKYRLTCAGFILRRVTEPDGRVVGWDASNVRTGQTIKLARATDSRGVPSAWHRYGAGHRTRKLAGLEGYSQAPDSVKTIIGWIREAIASQPDVLLLADLHPAIFQVTSGHVWGKDMVDAIRDVLAKAPPYVFAFSESQSTTMHNLREVLDSLHNPHQWDFKGEKREVSVENLRNLLVTTLFQEGPGTRI